MLLSKGMAMRLAPRMSSIIQAYHSAFIMGRKIYDNFHVVLLTCRWLYTRQCPSMLLKVDLAKALDSMAWPFLLEVLAHVGFPERWQD